MCCSVAVAFVALLADECKGPYCCVDTKEAHLKEARTAFEVLKSREDAEGGHDYHEEPSGAVHGFGAEIPATDHDHGRDKSNHSQPEEQPVYPRRKDHGLREEGDHSGKDKEDEQEILHDAATVAPAEGPSSASHLAS